MKIYKAVRIRHKSTVQKFISAMLIFCSAVLQSSAVYAETSSSSMQRTASAVDRKNPAEWERTIYLEDMGYAKDINLSGVTPKLDLYLKNQKLLRTAQAKINIRFSEALDKGSSITVLVDDLPLFTKNLSQTGYDASLSFNIPPVKGEFIKVTIQGHLYITGDMCADGRSGNLWMVVSKESRLTMFGSGYPETISDFFRSYDRDFNIVFDPEKASYQLLPLIYHINKLTAWKRINILTNNGPVQGTRNILIGDFAKDLELKDGDLYVSWKGITLLKDSLVDLYITSALQDSSISGRKAVKSKEITFADIGLKSSTLNGIGDLVFEVPIKYSHHSGVPRDLEMKLMMTHTPVPDGDNAILKILLDGILIKALALDPKGGTASYEVNIPDEFLSGYDNTLEVAVSYSIMKGECKGSIPTMTVSVLDNSYFSAAGVDRRGINTIMDLVGSISGNILLMIDDRNMMHHGIRLIDIIAKSNRDISDIAVAEWKGSIPEGYDYVILALNPSRTEDLNLPLKLHKNRFSITNPLTGKEVLNSERSNKGSSEEIFSSEYTDGFGVLETFDEKGTKVLLLSYYKEAKALEFLKTIGKEETNRFNGNVVMFNREIASYEVGDKYRVVYKDDKGLAYYWDRFKLVIILLMGLAVIAFIYYVNAKLVRGRD